MTWPVWGWGSAQSIPSAADRGLLGASWPHKQLSDRLASQQWSGAAQGRRVTLCQPSASVSHLSMHAVWLSRSKAAGPGHVCNCLLLPAHEGPVTSSMPEEALEGLTLEGCCCDVPELAIAVYTCLYGQSRLQAAHTTHAVLGIGQSGLLSGAGLCCRAASAQSGHVTHLLMCRCRAQGCITR